MGFGQGLLAFAGGAAEGASGEMDARREERAKLRAQLLQESLRDMEARRLAMEEARNPGILEKDQAEIGQIGANTAATNAGIPETQARTRVLVGQGDQYQDFTGGRGVPLRLGGRTVNLPGNIQSLSQFLPAFNQQAELDWKNANPQSWKSDWSMGRRTEGDIAPGTSGLTPRDIASFRVGLLKDIYTNPGLGQDIPTMDAAYGAALRSGRQILPEVFGEQPPDPTLMLLKSVMDDPGWADQRSASRAWILYKAQNPQIAGSVNEEAVMNYIGTLPRSLTQQGPKGRSFWDTQAPATGKPLPFGVDWWKD